MKLINIDVEQLIPGILPISHLLLTTNCSVNFLVYYLASGRALSRYLAQLWASKLISLSSQTHSHPELPLHESQEEEGVHLHHQHSGDGLH